MKAVLKKVLVAGVAAVALILATPSSSNGEVSERSLSSMNFPQVEATTSTKDMLSDYYPYLQFVLDIGRQTDPTHAGKLAKTFQDLRERSPENAARFLKGLRFELIHKLELMGYPPSKVSTNNQEMRRMVTKYTKIWYREAGEYTLRGIVARFEKKNAQQAE